ncbi:PTS sugar transporter subunit IIB [Clostridiales bacterium COT073_COT-073]|nr:PTS sugar transporter subunit IIB [Clostridiales bacterium COT073_COT-073]
MIRILCVCGNGMGTSTILKLNIKKICDKHQIEAEEESCAFGEAIGYLQNTDLVLTTPEWAGMLPPSNAVIATTKNLISLDCVEEALLKAIKENFPNELKQD